MQHAIILLSLGLVLTQSGSARSFDPPRPLPDGKVGEAIKRGAGYLKSLYDTGGSTDASHGTGPTSLAGLALLESGTPPSDPVILKIASIIREKSATEDGTYQVSLALLFLDRLDDPGDVARIQRLGTHLYLGQLASGGFTYKLPSLPAPVVSPQAAPAPPKPDQGFLPVKPKRPADASGAGLTELHPEVAPIFLAARQMLMAGGRAAGEGDNSNTQFGLIGLWVAKRRGVPVDDALALVGQRFLVSQNRTDGGWGYTPGTNSSASMTCAGQLGLAVGTQPKAPPPPPKDARANDPFYNPPAPKGKPANEVAPGSASTRAGLSLLARMVATVPVNQLKSQSGLGDEYYLLWSLERVAVALGLETLGGADWHGWGCGFILPAQQANGSWSGQYQSEVSTAFAMLFLLRANFTKDLTAKIKGRSQDPGNAELRGGMGFQPAMRPDDAAPPALGEKGVAAPPDSGQLAEALLNPDTFNTILVECRDGRGSAYTAAMLKAIPKLKPTNQEAARSALVARLTRMTTATLKAQLDDADGELRRAAAVAAGVKRDKALGASLADRVADTDDAVAQAARMALRILSGRDFGPEPAADSAAKQTARQAWTKWVLANPG